MNPNNIAAFPTMICGRDSNGQLVMQDTPGMTLLDYFAAKAIPECFAITMKINTERLKAMMKGEPWPDSPEDDMNWWDIVARDSYRIAAAMLEERKKHV